ncbi:DUF7513 family protein [Halopiger xanaduensis]|uniref:Deoxyribonuclease/rho motif-related TRAM n=1 Tax=Halopiger xanaduensis (strain DSM 18323 / JCM 14033 / SH-6) TaxID=797210 RepID=F8D4Z2_HALXS|nr:TRAM domain-containing protein [Halopiger xanaduensis]AEH38753.1 deoxyribonuclease/rho motif-related TRAM [Halopiger xanaduensis SH-6]
MSLFGKYMRGWTFRSSSPSLTEGDEIDVFVAESNSDEGHAYIGDTHLVIEGTGPETVEKRVRVRVTEFDDSTARGRGEFLEVVGESSYTE